jgi:hypothetical protein
MLLGFLVLAPGSAPARAKPTPAKADRDYVFALGTADRFLHAWQTQDEEDGLTTLTDEAKDRWPEERLEAFFAAADHAGYEISRGRKLKLGRYAFPVALAESSDAKVRRRFSEIIVMRTGKDWAVDQLP